MRSSCSSRLLALVQQDLWPAPARGHHTSLRTCRLITFGSRSSVTIWNCSSALLVKSRLATHHEWSAIGGRSPIDAIALHGDCPAPLRADGLVHQACDGASLHSTPEAPATARSTPAQYKARRTFTPQPRGHANRSGQPDSGSRRQASHLAFCIAFEDGAGTKKPIPAMMPWSTRLLSAGCTPACSAVTPRGQRPWPPTCGCEHRRPCLRVRARSPAGHPTMQPYPSAPQFCGGLRSIRYIRKPAAIVSLTCTQRSFTVTSRQLNSQSPLQSQDPRCGIRFFRTLAAIPSMPRRSGITSVQSRGGNLNELL